MNIAGTWRHARLNQLASEALALDGDPERAVDRFVASIGGHPDLLRALGERAVALASRDGESRPPVLVDTAAPKASRRRAAAEHLRLAGARMTLAVMKREIRRRRAGEAGGLLDDEFIDRLAQTFDQ